MKVPQDYVDMERRIWPENDEPGAALVRFWRWNRPFALRHRVPAWSVPLAWLALVRWDIVVFWLLAIVFAALAWTHRVPSGEVTGGKEAPSVTSPVRTDGAGGSPAHGSRIEAGAFTSGERQDILPKDDDLPILDPPDTTVVTAAMTPTQAPAPPAPRPATTRGAVVVASWYGPGFYGNTTYCGQTYTTEIHGVAHLGVKTGALPCGTLVTLSYGGRTVTVPAIDHGPHVAGRTFDLSNATRLALGCPDLCRVTWVQ